MRSPQHQNQVVCGLFKLVWRLAAHFTHFKCAKCKTIQFIQCHTKMAPRQNGVLLG